MEVRARAKLQASPGTPRSRDTSVTSHHLAAGPCLPQVPCSIPTLPSVAGTVPITDDRAQVQVTCTSCPSDRRARGRVGVWEMAPRLVVSQEAALGEGAVLGQPGRVPGSEAETVEEGWASGLPPGCYGCGVQSGFGEGE